MEHIRKLTIEGLRGYETAQSIDLAVPNGTSASGLTVIVGANNSGKSTIIEGLAALAGSEVTYSQGKRNPKARAVVRIQAEFVSGAVNILSSVGKGAQTEWTRHEVHTDIDIGIVQSRRGFDPFFGKQGPVDRRRYNQGGYQSQSQYRPQSLGSAFVGRLWMLDASGGKDRELFDELICRVMGREATLPWTIEQSDTGQYFLKFVLEDNTLSHSSEGVGEGIISLFVLLAALYDIDARSVVAIDEPELSLHPQYQRRLREVLAEKAAHSQIIYATHSPYFVNWNDIANGATIVRAFKDVAGALALRQPSRQTTDDLIALLGNDNSPHTLDLHASEVFFLEDGVIITEGQEDVVFFPKIDSAIGMSMGGSFYGWGAGGSGNIPKVCRLLRELDYTKVVAVFDGDKSDEAAKCGEDFPDYLIAVLPADDIRSKKARSIAEKSGLWTSKGFDSTKQMEMIAMYEAVNAYFATDAP